MQAARATSADWIDQPFQLANFIDHLGELKPFWTLLFLDVQGYDGCVSVLSVSFFREPRPFLVDVLTLGEKAFSTPGTESGRTLKDILESSEIKKAFFDVRGDAHALYRHYGIRLGGVQDLQLMEVVSRQSLDKRSLRSFADIVLAEIGMDSDEEVDKFNRTIERRKRLVALEGAGAQKMFNQRPLSADAVEYCILDVKFLHIMHFRLNDRLKRGEKEQVMEASKKWVEQGQAADFAGQGEHMAVAPTGLDL